jgi:endonuclease/exonuclease/phosphatase family metal-dependent hydrolase
MRFVTWNCNLSLAKKLDSLMELNPDVAVIQECEQDLKVPDGYSYIWCGNNPRKGLGVLAKNLKVVLEPSWRKEWTYFLPLSIPEKNLRLIATWAYNHRAVRFGTESVGSSLEVIKVLLEWIATGRSIMIGDFNNSIIWDKSNGKFNFADINSTLNSLGLESAYHQLTQDSQGDEVSSTFYHTKNVDKGYHIDYCFVHNTLKVDGLAIPSFDEWKSKSDHVPVILDLII